MKLYFPVGHVKSEVEFSLKKIDPQLEELHSAVIELLQFSGELALFNAHRLAPNYPNAERNFKYILEKLDIVLCYKRAAQEQGFKKIMQIEIYDKLTGALPGKVFQAKELSLSAEEAQNRLRSVSPVSQSSSARILKSTDSLPIPAKPVAVISREEPAVMPLETLFTKSALEMYTAPPSKIIDRVFGRI